MTTKDIIPTSQNPDSHVWTLSELIAALQQLQTLHGDLPIVGRGYEMGMDNLEAPKLVKLYRGFEGVCGTYAAENDNDPDATGVPAITLGEA